METKQRAEKARLSYFLLDILNLVPDGKTLTDKGVELARTFRDRLTEGVLRKGHASTAPRAINTVAIIVEPEIVVPQVELRGETS